MIFANRQKEMVLRLLNSWKNNLFNLSKKSA